MTDPGPSATPSEGTATAEPRSWPWSRLIHGAGLCLTGFLLALALHQSRRASVRAIQGFRPHRLAFAPDGSRLWVATKDAGLLQLDGRSFKVLGRPLPDGPRSEQTKMNAEGLEALAVDPSGRWLVLAKLVNLDRSSVRRTVEVRDARTGALLRDDGSTWPINPVNYTLAGRESIGPFFLPGQDAFVLVDPYGDLETWRLPDLVQVGRRKDPIGSRLGMAFSPDGRRVAFQGTFQGPCLFVWPELSPVEGPPIGDPRRRKLVWSRDGRLLTLTGRTAVESFDLPGPPPAGSPATGPELRLVADSDALNIVDLSSGRRLHRLQGGSARKLGSWAHWGAEQGAFGFFGSPVLRPDGGAVCFWSWEDAKGPCLQVWKPAGGVP